MATITVPVNITLEAAQRIAERGLKEPLDQMIEQAMKMVPGIRRVEISLEGPYDTHDEPYLEATAFRDYALYSERPQDGDNYDRWLVENVPDEVRWQVMLHIHWDAPKAR